MKVIKIFNKVGNFGEDKDAAREIRLREIKPCIIKKEEVVLDFDKVEDVTQSFIHALISELITDFGSDVLEKITFKKCNEKIQLIISIVVEYMQA